LSAKTGRPEGCLRSIRQSAKNVADRIEIEISEGGHAALPESGVKFLDRWLK